MPSIRSLTSLRTCGLLAGMACLHAAAAAGRAELAYGVKDDGTLVSFDTAAPAAVLTGTPVTGLQPGEVVRGLDFRPATGQLYALGSLSRLYTINRTTGAATQVGPAFTDASNGAAATSLNGTSFGFDFNPMIDRIRVVSDADQNLVINPTTGAVQAIATPLDYPAGDPNDAAEENVVHSAYDRNVAGTGATQLYGVDTGLDILVRQANNAGTLTTVGPLGTDVTDLGGFDISGATGTAFLAVRDATQTKSMLWTVNLTSGAGSFVGEIGGGITLTSFAVVPEPTSLAALAAPAVALAARRRRR